MLFVPDALYWQFLCVLLWASGLFAMGRIWIADYVLELCAYPFGVHCLSLKIIFI